MREIKFRVWDLKNSEWLEYKQFHVGWHEPIGFGARKIHMHCFVTSNGDGFSTLQFCLDNPETFIVEQFTGLKDKNGVEIYEGDIVQFSDWKPKAVKWCVDGYAGFSLDKTLEFLSDYDAERMIVLGNVYQNPELLA